MYLLEGNKPIVASSSVRDDVAMGMDFGVTFSPESSARTQKGKAKVVCNNGRLKGRKRFLADLADMAEECGTGLVIQDLTVKSASSLRERQLKSDGFLLVVEGPRAGEDEGTIEFKILDKECHHVLSVNLLVSGALYLILTSGK